MLVLKEIYQCKFMKCQEGISGHSKYNNLDIALEKFNSWKNYF